jgi:signal transduction histidine kinase
VVRNLLNNAIKYTHSGGEITCECRLQNGTSAPENEWPGSSYLDSGLWAALRVVDTGTGIDADHLPKVFDRFYRVNAQGNVPGVGLGLSIAKELVELHKGHIAVSSTPGKGSVFAIYLPLNAE